MSKGSHHLAELRVVTCFPLAWMRHCDRKELLWNKHNGPLRIQHDRSIPAKALSDSGGRGRSEGSAESAAACEIAGPATGRSVGARNVQSISAGIAMSSAVKDRLLE